MLRGTERERERRICADVTHTPNVYRDFFPGLQPAQKRGIISISSSLKREREECCFSDITDTSNIYIYFFLGFQLIQKEILYIQVLRRERESGKEKCAFAYITKTSTIFRDFFLKTLSSLERQRQRQREFISHVANVQTDFSHDFIQPTNLHRLPGCDRWYRFPRNIERENLNIQFFREGEKGTDRYVDLLIILILLPFIEIFSQDFIQSRKRDSVKEREIKGAHITHAPLDFKQASQASKLQSIVPIPTRTSNSLQRLLIIEILGISKKYCNQETLEIYTKDENEEFE